MKFCIKCGAQLSEEASFCSACGLPLNQDQPSIINENPQENIKIEENEIAILDNTTEVSVENIEKTQKEDSGIKPIVAIPSIIATLLIFYKIVDIFDIKVDQIIGYVLMGVAGLIILGLIGATMTWSEKNGKNALVSVTYILGGLSLFFLAYLFIDALVEWLS